MTDYIRVLLIEADRGEAGVVREHLRRSREVEYGVTWIESAADGVDALERQDHDVCLLGATLGRESAIDILTIARQTDEIAPCVALLDEEGPLSLGDVLDAGAFACLLRGAFTSDDLERSIRDTVDADTAWHCRKDLQSVSYTVFESEEEAMALFDASGSVMIANESAHRLFGLDTAGLAGVDWRFLVQRDPYQLDRSFAASIRQPCVQSQPAVNGRRPDGTTFAAQLSVSSIRDGEDEYFAAALREVHASRPSRADGGRHAPTMDLEIGDHDVA